MSRAGRTLKGILKRMRDKRRERDIPGQTDLDVGVGACEGEQGREDQAPEDAKGGGETEARERTADGPDGGAEGVSGLHLLGTLLLLGILIGGGCGYRWRMELFEETRGLQIEAEGRTDGEAGQTSHMLLRRVSVSTSTSERTLSKAQGGEADPQDVRQHDAKAQARTRVTLASPTRVP